MKKSSYHVNPAVNKWEEEQRRARMEKMIQRAKSTLPPEARGGSKPSGPKKPSPYSAENNATKVIQKRSTGGQGTPAGAAAMDVQELDSLIYNRVQEILGTPLMRRAAAARAASKGAAILNTPQSGRGGRRPAWNEDWNAQTGPSPPAKHEERCISDAGARRGTSNPPYERSSPKSTSGSTRAGPSHVPSGSTPTKGKRIPAPSHINIPVSGIGTGVPLQRRPGTRMQAAEERVVLLPSPSPAATATKSPIVRPSSSRYGSAAGALAGGEAVEPPAGTSDQLLGKSMVAAIEALNPQALAARVAVSRITQNQRSHGCERLGYVPDASSTGPGSIGGVSAAASGSYHDRMGRKPLSDSVSGGGAAGVSSRDASLMQSLAAAAGVSQGLLGATSVTSSSRRPPLAPAQQRASGRGIHQAPQGGGLAFKGRGGRDDAEEDNDDEDNAYTDDDFEEYDSTEDEHQHLAQQLEAEPGNEEGLVMPREYDGGAGSGAPDIALLRDSVNALNELVQLKIQQELARGQQQQQQQQQQVDPSLNRQSLQVGKVIDPGEQRQVSPPDMLASLTLVGSEESDGRDGAHGPGRIDPTMSSLGDGLRQSDLDYLARLGGGEPHDGLEVATSTDERPFIIEPGAPAGTAKAWGDRHAWTTEKGADSGGTGLQKLRDRQDRERQHQGFSAGGQRRHNQQGLHGGETQLSRKEAEPTIRVPGASGAVADQGDEDSVLLGETLTPRHRTGTAAQMQAVSNALAALASSGQLSSGDAHELRQQTDALYGSLVQLHDLMNGPRGAELCSSSPTRGDSGAAGFTPTAQSPEDSPSQSLRRQAAGAPKGSVESYPARPTLQRTNNLGDGETSTWGPKPADVTEGAARNAAPQLTPKHRLIADDVAWMAGLMQSLSKSLQVDNGEVAMLGL
ncbi:hypothetical protein VaNZ11_004017 [Volvox africanus]|uniref:Spindle and centriole-associated protein 1 n=1 Tax=Volvox africanus TaxID=51714 RepID=A0ABQ5RW77_9CHLO|nr:hypothetical protein VaNZ11_004017 [Volvox africanus]